MSILSSLFTGSDTVKTIGDTVDKLFTSDEERLEKQNEALKAEREYQFLERKLSADQNVQQIEVNKVEAASGSVFVAGWRPAIGWVGALALLYQFLIYPLFCWVLACWFPVLTPPPPPQNGELYPLIMGMLGIGAMRSFDKLNNIDTKRIE